jgi:hypothetical protein
MNKQEITQHAIDTAKGVGDIVRSNLKSQRLQQVALGMVAQFGDFFAAAELRRDWKLIDTIEKALAYYWSRWNEVKADVQSICAELDKSKPNTFGIVSKPKHDRNRLTDLGLDDLLGDKPTGLN